MRGLTLGLFLLRQGRELLIGQAALATKVTKALAAVGDEANRPCLGVRLSAYDQSIRVGNARYLIIIGAIRRCPALYLKAQGHHHKKKEREMVHR